MSPVDEFINRVSGLLEGFPAPLAMSKLFNIIRLLAEKIVELAGEDEARRILDNIAYSILVSGEETIQDDKYYEDEEDEYELYNQEVYEFDDDNPFI